VQETDPCIGEPLDIKANSQERAIDPLLAPTEAPAGADNTSLACADGLGWVGALVVAYGHQPEHDRPGNRLRAIASTEFRDDIPEMELYGVTGEM
jgi:hypothetical protein